MALMSGTLEILALAMALFIVTHVALPAAGLRAAAVRALGEWGYMAGYSILSIALLTWVIVAYKAAPLVEVLEPNTAMRHASLTAMLLAAFLLIGGMAGRNPSTVQAAKLGWKPRAVGVLKITRHPMMWAVAFWGLSHAMANGHAAALILFGGMTILALAGAWHLDRRKRSSLGDDWLDFEAETSFFPLVAIAAGKTRLERGEIPWWQSLGAVALYIGMLAAHAYFGRDVFPLGFF